ncbi:MAG: HK97 gp10 family phage protein, partial [Janthinobacterium lividum]
MTPGELAERLARLQIAKTQEAALEAAAARLAVAVRDALSAVPGDAPGHAHDAPWVRSGALRDSIGHAVDADRAVVGSGDPVAAFQECGTPRMPPRPFLAPAAAVLG